MFSACYVVSIFEFSHITVKGCQCLPYSIQDYCVYGIQANDPPPAYDPPLQKKSNPDCSPIEHFKAFLSGKGRVVLSSERVGVGGGGG